MANLMNLLSSHDDLDHVIRNPKGDVFISEWNCVNPMAYKYLSWENDVKIPSQRSSEYVYFKDDAYLKSMAVDFHEKNDQVKIDGTNLIFGAGSTPLITTLCLWLQKNKIEEVVYLPPLYYTFYYILNILGIKTRPVSQHHAFEENFRAILPKKNTVLILADPIWYAGKCIPESIISQIAEWQKETGSKIFVDGSFQYTKWNGSRNEFSSMFDINSTFRVICPTKALAVHGYRFSYLICPSKYQDDLSYIYDNTCGATPLRNLIFAQRAMMQMVSLDSNLGLLSHIKAIYQEIEGKVSPLASPDAGYFFFAKIKNPKCEFIGMNSSYFDMPIIEDYIRINILAPNLNRII